MRDNLKSIKEIAEMIGKPPKAVDAWARYHIINPQGRDLKDNKTRLFDPAPFLAHYNEGAKPAPTTVGIPDGYPMSVWMIS